jgi:hypothetical protein
MNDQLRQLLIDARARYEKLSKVEKMSLFALQSLGYVASETFMGVIEDHGDFKGKKSSALGALRWLQNILHGRADEYLSRSPFLEKVWLLTPADMQKAREKIEKLIEELIVLDKGEERAVRFIQ